MGNQDIQVELESIDRAVGAMNAQVVDEITSLSRDWTHFLQGLDRQAWSAEDSCDEFGRAYVAAIEAYDQVLQGVKKDVVRYRDELEATVIAYRSRDDAVMGQMNAQIARLGTLSQGDDMGVIAHHQREWDLDNGPGAAAAPADTSPGE